jgi:hypothetical protein
MFVKEKRANGSDDIGKNGSRHIGYVAFLKNRSKKVIKADIHQIPEDRIPDTDNKETNFYLMFRPQLFP